MMVCDTESEKKGPIAMVNQMCLSSLTLVAAASGPKCSNVFF